MDYKSLYEAHYGDNSKFRGTRKRQFWGLRKLLARYDEDRYTVARKYFIPSGKRILDLGCGGGYLLSQVNDYFEEFYGIDVAPSRLRKARQKFREYGKVFSFIEHNLDDPLPYQDNFFDCVTALAIVEHVFNIYGLFSEISRVTRSGGCLIVQVPNLAYFVHRFGLLLGKLPVTSSPTQWNIIGWDGGHLHYFTEAALISLIEEYAFKVIESKSEGFLAKFRHWRPSLLSGGINVKAIKR